MQRYWQTRNPVSIALTPLSLLYCTAVLLRRALYGAGLLRRRILPVPVVVIGNLTVGGTGKTPLVVWTARFLHERGHRPGIVSRGYGGRRAAGPRRAHADSDPADVGDEAVLLARRAACPVMVGADRVAVGRRLLAEHDCDVVISDDGLQHLRLKPTVAVSVVDGERRFGNGLCLPAGPLREPARFASRVDIRVCSGRPRAQEVKLDYAYGELVSLADPAQTRPLASLPPGPVHAVAGIGHPERFFAALESMGVEVVRHPFADHHRFRPEELDFAGTAPVVMTEKDAVKCERFADTRLWWLPVEARPEARYGERLLQRLADA